MPLSGFNTLIPVTFLYEHDSNLLFNQNTFATQQGLPLNLVNALSSCKDETILNYSNIFLTDTLKVDDVIHINSKQTLPLNFATYLGLSGYPNITSNTVYVTLSADPSLSAALTFSTSLSDATHTHFMFNDIDGLRCRISVIDNSWTKNLTVNLSTFNCYFSVRTPVISAQNSDIFEYSLEF